MTTRAIRIAVLLSLAGLVAMVSRAQDPFAPDKQLKTTPAALDPFALEFQYKSTGQPKVEVKEPGKKDGPELSLTAKSFLEKLKLKVSFDPPKAKRGEVVKLIIEGDLKPGNYTYALTKKTADTRKGNIPVITVDLPALLLPLFPQQETPEPTSKSQQVGKSVETLLVHKKSFTWTQTFQVKDEASIGVHKVPIHLQLMVCNDARCDGPDEYPGLETSLDVLGGSPVKTDLAQLKLQITPNSMDISGPGKGVPPGTQTTGNPSEVDPNNLPALLLFAFVGALLMLLTPCVFPMIPITVNFFLKQSEKEHHRPLRMATVYAGTIILLLTLTMVAFGGIVVALAENEWFNLVLGGILIFFALSLFGMYEIELPHFLARFTSAREGHGGNIGTIFMALTFTITSFTCTGPFMGVLLSGFAQSKPPFIYQILAAFVYAVTFAAPFFLMALFPTLLKKLPKSGGWMNCIKVVMGFLELGAALKFLANADYAIFRGEPRLFTFDIVLCSWIALSLASGLYLLGQFRLPHDDPTDTVGVLRMIFGTIFLGMTLYMLPILFGGRPTGMIGEGILAFLPPRPVNSNTGMIGPNNQARQGTVDSLPWHKDYIEGWQAAQKNKKLIFIDFTGVYCTNCRANEENVFPREDVLKELGNYTLVKLFCDTVPNPKLSGSEAREQALRNKKWRDRFTSTSALPSYVIFRPDGEEAFAADGLPKGKVLGYQLDLIRDKDSFVQFLKSHTETLAWHRDYLDAWAEARLHRKPIFINFTSIYNTNARANEVNVFSKENVANELKKFIRVELDVSVTRNPDPKEAALEGQKHGSWRDKLINRLSVPAYLAFQPDFDQPFQDDGLPKGRFIDIRGGEINDVADFIQFLQNSLQAPVATAKN